MRYRKVLIRRPIGLYDPQQLPPYGWCPACGMEVYEPDQNLCARCKEKEEQDAQ